MVGTGGRRGGRGLRRARMAVLLALLPGLVGLGLIRWPATEGLERNGLDLLFQWRGPNPTPPEVCVVAIDLASYDAMDVDPKDPWPRALHADLIRTLHEEGARAIAFDVLFLDEGEPGSDLDLEWALEEAGNVVLGATTDQVEDPLFRQARRIEPYAPFAAAAAALGEVNLPTDADDVIRSAWLAPDGRPGLALSAYEVATGDSSLRSGEARLMDYYGPARTVKTVSLYQALDPGQYLPDGFFRDRIVFVGLSEKAATGPAPKDAFPTPYTGGRGETTYGVEIHATLAANLLQGRKIDLLAPALENALLLLLPILALLTFAWLGPLYGAGALVVLAAFPWAAGYLAFTRESLWMPTVIPSTIQLPLAYTVAAVWYYLTTLRERERVKRAFSFYLSPESARQIAEDPSALNLGGEEIVATAMFTDIAGFTSVAESMTAEETAAMLNRYFSDATRHVFDTGGTLVKYIGDAVFAIWGAPVRVPDHAARACRAALALARMDAEQGEADVDDPAGRLRTRIGVHTGPMLVGNLGSNQRFDYTAIGDAVNLAARIEGINKMFGTHAIVSGDTLEAAGGDVTVRRLGRVQVVGRGEPVALYELVGDGEHGTVTQAVLDAFADALAAFERAAFDEAADGFRKALSLAGDEDGPSAFYVTLCERLAREGVGPSWSGVIEATSK